VFDELSSFVGVHPQNPRAMELHDAARRKSVPVRQSLLASGYERG
jgi:hypothetical protein